MEGTPGSGCEIYPLKNNKKVFIIEAPKPLIIIIPKVNVVNNYI